MNGSLNYNKLNTTRLNNSTDYPYSIFQEARRLQDAKPRTKIEYIDLLGNVTDISVYYLSGANFEQIKERAPDEIQAGNFDIVLSNQDNYFTEFDPACLFYGVQYHGAKIRVWQGFVLPNGIEEYEVQAVGFIDELRATDDSSSVTLRCRDRIRLILDEKLHSRPSSEVVVEGATNVGNGVVSIVETKPFKTKNETWTLTCTTPGADGVAIFSVVGSVSGSVGPATSGTQFSTLTGAGGIKFTISAASTPWSLNDSFTFSSKQYPEWSGVNIGKIIWSVLTGYNWDTNTQEAWSDQVLELDHTQSDSNTDVDYLGFASTIAALDSVGAFNLYGFADYDEDTVDFIQNLVLLFLGSVFTAPDGRISIKSYVPSFAGTEVTNFSDARQIRQLGYQRTIDEVINYVSVHFKKTNVWQFSDEDTIYDGNFVATNSDSISKYGELTSGFSVRWFATNGEHVEDFADRLVGKYGDPPLNISFVTGLDAMFAQIGDIVSVTDTKYVLDEELGEISKITKQFDSSPCKIALVVRRDSEAGFAYGFLGSEVDEGDGLSPQNVDYDSASFNDKLFCYLGHAGQALPNYRMF